MTWLVKEVSSYSGWERYETERQAGCDGGLGPQSLILYVFSLEGEKKQWDRLCRCRRPEVTRLQGPDSTCSVPPVFGSGAVQSEQCCVSGVLENLADTLACAGRALEIVLGTNHRRNGHTLDRTNAMNTIV